MNPLLTSALLSVLRWVLTIGAGWFVRKGIWTDANATEYVAAAAMGLISLGWSIWNKRKDLIARMTALAMPMGSTPADLHETIAAGLTASLSTPHDQTPVITKAGL